MLVSFFRFFLLPLLETPGDDLGGGSGPTQEEFAAMQQRALAAEQATARSNALRQYPTLDEALINDYQGTPEQIASFAEKMHNNITSRIGATPPAETPPPVVPTPTPGVGAAPTAGDVEEARLDELTSKVVFKEATRGSNSIGRGRTETDELFNLSINRGFKELAGR